VDLPLVQILELVAVRKEKEGGCGGALFVKRGAGGALPGKAFKPSLEASSFRPKRQMVSRQLHKDASESVLRTRGNPDENGGREAALAETTLGASFSNCFLEDRSLSAD
jgi:hypothetical protein